MMLTTKGRYAVMAILELIELSNCNGNKPVKLADIATQQEIPLNYLEQIFNKLRRSHLVQSVKGPGGGYLLGREPSLLTVADIIDAVEENIKMTKCSIESSCRPDKHKCKTHDLWQGLGNHIRDYFIRISFADIIAGNTA